MKQVPPSPSRIRKIQRKMEESMEEKAEISTEEDPFNRLPEELIVFIFEKISDAKCLCFCSSVSKSFAALVLRTRVVFAAMPGETDVCSCHPDPSAFAVPLTVRVCRVMHFFLRNAPRFLHRPIMFLLSLLKFLLSLLRSNADVRPSGIINFVKKFSCLESITIHSSFRTPSGAESQARFEPLLRWKFGPSGFNFFSAKNRVALSDDADSSVQMATNLTMEEIAIQIVLMRCHFVDSMSRVANVHKIVAGLPNIKHVATVDNMKQGIVVLDEEAIAIVKEENLWKADDKVLLKLWKAPAVKLPIHGCIMEDVSLILIRPIEGCHALMAENSFEEEEYRKLATILVKEEASFECIFPVSVLSS